MNKEIRVYKMRNLFLYSALLLAGLGISNISLAQEANEVEPEIQPVKCLHPFGESPEDSLEMRKIFSLYQEAIRNKQYNDAYPLWQTIMEKAPCARQMPYVDAETFFVAFLADENLKDKHEVLLDSFLNVFPQRIKYFGSEGAVKGRWAYYLNKYKPQEFAKVIELSERAIELDKNELEYIVASTYFTAIFNGFKNKQQSKEDILNAYDKIGSIMEHNVNNSPYATNWKQIQDWIEGNIGIFIKSSDIDEIFIPRLEKNPDDIALMEKIVNMYRNAKASDNPNYTKVLKTLFEKKPDANSAEELGRYYENANNTSEAISYYLKAADMTEDSKRKETIYLKVANNYLKNKNFSQAEAYSKRVLSINPNNGYALITEATAVYSLLQANCDKPLDKKAAAWVAIDMLERAISLDPSIRADAQSRINSYQKHAPSTDEAFFHGIASGETYTFDCNGKTTKVRFFDN